MNRDIRFPEVLVILPDGQQAGIMTPQRGREIAEEHGLDLVEVAPNARPPVCKVMDYGKFLYDESKKKAGQTSRPAPKTVRLRPKTDDHDLETKRKRLEKFLKQGNPVRIEMRMRGRERAYPARWIEVMKAFLDAVEQPCEVTNRPALEGRNISAMVQPVDG